MATKKPTTPVNTTPPEPVVAPVKRFDALQARIDANKAKADNQASIDKKRADYSVLPPQKSKTTSEIAAEKPVVTPPVDESVMDSSTGAPQGIKTEPTVAETPATDEVVAPVVEKPPVEPVKAEETTQPESKPEEPAKPIPTTVKKEELPPQTQDEAFKVLQA